MFETVEKSYKLLSLENGFILNIKQHGICTRKREDYKEKSVIC